MKESWQGRAIPQVEISCWECDRQDYFKAPFWEMAARCGWRKIKGKWHCGACAAKADESKKRKAAEGG